MKSPAFEEAQNLRDNGKVEEAIKKYTTIREDAIKIHDKKTASECLHMIGVAYYQSQEYVKAEETLQKSLREFKKEGDREFLGFVLRDLGINARSSGKLDEAETFLNESISILHDVGNVGHEGISKVKLGNVFSDKDQFDSAVQLIKQGIDLLATGSDEFFLSSAYLDLAKVLLKKGDKTESLENANKSLEVLNSFAKQDKFLEKRKDIKNLLDELQK